MPRKDDLIHSLDEGFAELSAVIRLLPPAALHPTGGAWGAFEVIAHLAGWHDSASARLRQIARAEEPTPPGDADAMNARFVREKAALGPDRLLEDLAASFAGLRAATVKLPEATFREGSYALFVVESNGPHHYAEHSDDLRRLPAIPSEVR